MHANSFLGRGFAFFFYDKRGSGNSTGKLPYATYDDLASDVVAAVKYLRTRNDVIHDQVGLIGRSEGGWTAPLVAAKLGDIAFVISSVGTPLSPGDQVLSAIEVALREAGASPEETLQALALRKRIWEYYRRGASEKNLHLAQSAQPSKR